MLAPQPAGWMLGSTTLSSSDSMHSGSGYLALVPLPAWSPTTCRISHQNMSEVASGAASMATLESVYAVTCPATAGVKKE